MPNPFSGDGDWYKGNLHTHTTVSDGELSPQETIRTYAEGDYDFLALTDHDAVVDYDGLDAHGMTLITGCELAAGRGALGQTLHVVALGLNATPQLPDSHDFAELVAAVAAQSQLCFLGHPFWSLIEAGELLDLCGHVGIEVYNATCQCGCARGPSEMVWDILLAHQKHLWGFAVDDAHHSEDYCQGWVWVRSAQDTPAAILEALKEGHFYASAGPRIYDVAVEAEQVRVRCSPCRQIAVVEATAGGGGSTDRLAAQPPFEEIRLPHHLAARPFRVEVVDDQGHKAWTNPFFPDEVASQASVE